MSKCTSKHIYGNMASVSVVVRSIKTSQHLGYDGADGLCTVGNLTGQAARWIWEHSGNWYSVDVLINIITKCVVIKKRNMRKRTVGYKTNTELYCALLYRAQVPKLFSPQTAKITVPETVDPPWLWRWQQDTQTHF